MEQPTLCHLMCNQGSENPVLKSPTYRVLGFYRVFGFFLFERTVGKLVGWFSSPAKLLFRSASTLDYVKIRKFITYWSLEADNIKKSLKKLLALPAGWMAAWAVTQRWGQLLLAWQTEIKLSLVRFLLVFQWVLTEKTSGLLWVLPGCLNPVWNSPRHKIAIFTFLVFRRNNQNDVWAQIYVEVAMKMICGLRIVIDVINVFTFLFRSRFFYIF